MKTKKYRNGYLAGYKAAKDGSQPNDDILGPMTHKRLDHERNRTIDDCLDILESWKIPVGNSCSGELAAEWTYDALRDIRAKIKALRA